jgi:hexulose-6-phosphate isomerase
MVTSELASNKIGFMQGRLSPIENGRIQSFPSANWKNEFEIANQNNFNLIEWTVDTPTLDKNPIALPNSVKEILENSLDKKIKIPSVTCDFFMENPPWKSNVEELENVLIQIMLNMKFIFSKMLVIPLVDNSSITDTTSLDKLIKFFERIGSYIEKSDIQICFESDFSPPKLAHFINEFPAKYFGINYDIGNSASLGFHPLEEINNYGNRILNVHVKDREFGGSTVPLGKGSVDFDLVFKSLIENQYKGNFILQAARSTEGEHLSTLLKYRSMVVNWIQKYE